MDEIKRPFLPHPMRMANVFSKFVSVWWLNDLFRKGNRKPLENDDIYQNLPEDDTKCLTDRLESLWKDEVERASSKNTTPRLGIVFLRFLGFPFLLFGILALTKEVVRVIIPLFVGELVSYFSPNSEVTRTEAYIYGAAIIVGTFAIFILHHPAFLLSTRFGMRLRIAAGCLVYRKILRLSQSSFAMTSTGHIVNVVTSDVQKLEQAAVFLNHVWISPLVVLLAAVLSWKELGPSVLPGIAFLVLLAPLQGCLGQYFAILRTKTAALTDDRIKLMNEIIAGMRVIKMYTWEKSFAKMLHEARRSESRMIKKTGYARALNAAVYFSAITLISFVIFTTYVMTDHSLTAEKVFVVIGLFASCRVTVAVFFPFSVMGIKEASVSARRIQELLELEEKSANSSLVRITPKPMGADAKVEVYNMSACWSKASVPVLKEISFKVEPGELYIIVGPVGSGKTALLLALLGELEVSEGSITVQGKVGFSSQQPWIFSGTVRENVVFGQTYDEKRYNEVIQCCALRKDLKLLPYGDSTLVGERGVALSGGQKARINLARAVYYNADVYLLDDPLSAVDTRVGRQLFDECILGLLKSKICILVTHQLQYLKLATSIVGLKEGRCVKLGSYAELEQAGFDVESLVSCTETLLNSDVRETAEADTVSGKPRSAPKLLAVEKRESSASTLSVAIRRERSVSDLSAASYMECIFEGEGVEHEGELQEKEDRRIGSVTWSIYKSFWRAGAGPLLLIILCLLLISAQVLIIMAEWWLSKWADLEEQLGSVNTTASEYEDVINARHPRVIVYAVIVFVGFCIAVLLGHMFFKITIAASQNLHDLMFSRVLQAPIYFFDTNPVGRVLNRFSKDIGQMDDVLPGAFFDFCRLTIFSFSILLLNVVSMPYLLIAAIPIMVCFGLIRNYYLRTSREIKRLEALNRSPFYSHLSASLQGLLSIRAFKASDRFISKYSSYQDDHTAAWFLFLASSRWLGSRLDFLCASFITVVTLMPLLLSEVGVGMTAGLVGLCLTYARFLTGMFQWCVRQSAEVENVMTSVERVLEYSNLENERDLHVPGSVPPGWPQHGAITAERLYYAHHPSLPVVLRNVNFSISAQEKVGVVGRTGAGKSSLMSALFRLAEPEGLIHIDGVHITDIGLHDLRSQLSVIPQDPVLFAGSLKKNLDPFGDHSDTELWNVLEEVQLKEAVDELPDGLHTQLAEAGSNFSVGQRQLVCLARAILRHNKILFIDEATANVDQSTDSLIQETIRLKFKECTVLTIAHRLNTIMDCDRVMVLDEGGVVEFDAPYLLLQDKGGHFSNMVEQTGKTTSASLYEAARQAYELRLDALHSNELEETHWDSPHEYNDPLWDDENIHNERTRLLASGPVSQWETSL